MLNASSYSHRYIELSIHLQASPWIYLFHILHMFVDLSINLSTFLKLLDSYTTYIRDPDILHPNPDIRKTLLQHHD